MAFENEITEIKSRRRTAPFPPEMRARWHQLGFDIEAADLRYARLCEEISHVVDVSDLIGKWVHSEQEAALAAGIGEDDPDFWRIRAASKHIAPYGGGRSIRP